MKPKKANLYCLVKSDPEEFVYAGPFYDMGGSWSVASLVLWRADDNRCALLYALRSFIDTIGVDSQWIRRIGVLHKAINESGLPKISIPVYDLAVLSEKDLEALRGTTSAAGIPLRECEARDVTERVIKNMEDPNSPTFLSIVEELVPFYNRHILNFAQSALAPDNIIETRDEIMRLLQARAERYRKSLENKK